MHNELVELGSILKGRRQERNLSLKEIENATSIRMTYLEAIEAGEIGKLISPIYAQGFIKKYATFLGMDADSLIREHPYVMKVLSSGMSTPSDFTLGVGALEVRGSPGGEVKWLPNLLWVGLSALVLLCGWFLAKHFGVL